jgi:hypothetical protein
MQSSIYKKDRYPGLRSFDKTQVSLFFGRDAETTELFNLVSLEKLVVLFSKSGLGKSSLLNAGLSPLLEQNGFKPIRIRFSPGNRISPKDAADDTNLLLRDFIVAFNGFDNSNRILFDKNKPQLWEYIKSTSFTNKEGEALTPVFIFDQFEEFFYHPQLHQQEFLRQLAEVVHEQPPRRVLEWVTGIEAAKRKPEEILWHQQPVVKMVFAMRSDKLSLMQSLTVYIKTILRNRYELKPLTRQQALAAIEQPAVKDMGEGYTPAFTFNKTTLAAIVNELGSGSDEIESSQLQMVCNYIEQQVRIKQDEEDGIQAIEVNENIIVPARDILGIRNNFYENQLKQIADAADRALARKVIEDELVVDGQRASLLEKQLVTELEGKKELVEALLKARLIREENTNRGLTYEVSHDTLIEPIEKSKQKRQEEEEKVKDEAERQRLALEAQKRNEELKENLKRLANEMQLREEAESQRAEAEKQTLEAQKQRKSARYFARLSAFLMLLVVIAGGIFAYISIKNSASKREKAEDKAKQAEQTADSAKTKEEGYRKKLIGTYVLLDSIMEKKNDNSTLLVNPVTNIADTTLSAVYDIIKDTKKEDTADIQFQKLINNTYRRVKKMDSDTQQPKINRTFREKVKYIEEKLPGYNKELKQGLNKKEFYNKQDLKK